MPSTKHKYRRRTRHQFINTDGVAVGVTKSFTRDDGTEYHPVVSLITRRVDCQCPHFRFRLARLQPTIDTPELHCKHIAREVGILRRRGLI